MNNHIIIIVIIIILISLSLIFSIWFFEFKCTTNCKNKKCGDDDGCKGKCQTGKCNSNMECKGGVCTELCQYQPNNDTLRCGGYNFVCEKDEECNVEGNCVNKPCSGYYIQSANKQFYVKMQNNEGFLVDNIADATYFTVKEINSFGYEVLDYTILIPDQKKTLNLITETRTYSDGHKEYFLLTIENLNFTYLNVNDGPGKICSTNNKDNICTQQKSSFNINSAHCLKIRK